jgi:SWI/SNF-related matrix-associated actin-dependent regulator 1 of chromatin subfamily A
MQTALFPTTCHGCKKPIGAGEFLEKGPKGKGSYHPSCLAPKNETGISRFDGKLIGPLDTELEYLPYQKEDIQRMMTMKAVLLASQMGVGKTIEVIGLLNQFEPNGVCIVCPSSLRLNWKHEIKSWWAKPRSVTLFPDETTTPDLGICIVSFNMVDLLPSDYKPEWLIIDEAHYVKNPDAKRTIAIKKLAARTQRRVAVTGSPIENRAKEIWTLLQMLDPEFWDPAGYWKGQPVGIGQGAGWMKFAKRYCGGRLVKHKWGSRLEFDANGSTHLDELNAKLKQSVMIRRLKSEVLKDLPPKRRQIYVIPQEDQNAIKALETEHEAFVATGYDYECDIEVLQKASLDFAELAKARKDVGIRKIPYVCELISNTFEGGEEALVVLTHHKEVAWKIADEFRHLDPAVLTGDDSEVIRDKAVQRFQGGETPLFIGTIGAAGVGLTLTRASTGIMAELIWKDLSQAEDRLHRIGQTHPVLWIYPVFDWSVDANMIKLILKKMKIVRRALDQ